jgi:MFS family permease
LLGRRATSGRYSKHGSGPSGGPRVGVQLGALLAAAALSNVAYTILIPFVPTLQSRFGMGAVAVGVAFGGFAAAKALTQPFGGWAVDRLCARTVAVAGLILAAMATAALATAGRAIEVIGYRLLWGIGEGFAIPALYRLASTLGSRSVHGKARVLGWFGSAAVVGMTLGPGVIAVFADTLTFRTAFALGAVLTASAAAVLRCTVERDLGRTPAPQSEATSPGGAARAVGPRLLVPVVVGFGLLDFVNNFVYAALEPVLPLYARHHRSVHGGRLTEKWTAPQASTLPSPGQGHAPAAVHGGNEVRHPHY